MFEATLYWCLILVVPAGMAAALCLYTALSLRDDGRLRLAWSLFGAALLSVAGSEVLRLSSAASGASGHSFGPLMRDLALWSALYSLPPILICGGVFVYWSASIERRIRSITVSEAIMDSLVAGGSAASFLWWFAIEPVLHYQTQIAQAELLSISAPILTLPLLASSLHFVSIALLGLYVLPQHRKSSAGLWLMCGVCLLVIERYTFLCLALSAAQSGLFAFLGAAACCCFGVAAVAEGRYRRRAETRQPAVEDDGGDDMVAAMSKREAKSLTADVANAIETLAKTPHRDLLETPLASTEELHWVVVRRTLTMLLPALVLIGFAWHIASGSHGYRFDSVLNDRLVRPLAAIEPWGVACIVILALLRHTSRPTPIEEEDKEWVEELQKSTITMGEELHRRTYQLSLLHAVTADLNDSLDCTGVLFTALERMSQAVNADAGAIWLRLDLDEMSGRERRSAGADDIEQWRHGTKIPDTLNHTNFILRELEQWESDRRSLAKLQQQSKIRSDEVDNLGSMPVGRRWRLARVKGDSDKTCRAALGKIHGALEGGGLSRGVDAGKKLNPGWGSAHIAAVRWKGAVLGAVCLVRKAAAFEEHERAMLDTLGLEVGRALQNAQLFQEATRLADRDSLTDLLNHRAMQQHLNAILAQSRRGRQEFSVVLMDVNNFKYFNDTYGHPVGDRIIRTVAHCLRETCRKEDIVGRFGGDEFMVILTNTGPDGAQEVCSHIAARLEQEAYTEPGSGRRIPVAVSFGAAVYPHDAEGSLDLLSVADSNLHEAKQSGDRVLVQHRHAEDALAWRRLRDADQGGSFGVLDALVTAIDNKDHYTRRHSEDVTQWALLMARALGYSDELRRTVRICGLLHDVGKIAVPDVLLRKPGKLDADENKIMRQHPVFGALIVQNVPDLAAVQGGVRHHHERFDGKGYPDGLAGEHIPLLGRLLAVPDCFSAMTTERPYRKALSWSEAIDEIEKGKGRHFDPEMVEIFLEVIAGVMTGKGQRSEEERALKISLVPQVAKRGQLAAPFDPFEATPPV